MNRTDEKVAGKAESGLLAAPEPLTLPALKDRERQGRVFCEEDAPEGAEPPPPSPAELEATGQMRLPGVA